MSRLRASPRCTNCWTQGKGDDRAGDLSYRATRWDTRVQLPDLDDRQSSQTLTTRHSCPRAVRGP